jgi:hypothetical protein
LFLKKKIIQHETLNLLKRNFLFLNKKNNFNMDIAAKKNFLIDKILRLTSAEQLDWVENALEQAEHINDKATETVDEEDYRQYLSPIKDDIDIDEMIKEQNYQGYDSSRAEELAREMDIQEPLDELLKMLTP